MHIFTIELPLKTEIYQEDILNKRFEIGRQIYNGLLNVTYKRYKEMIKTKKYRNLMASLSGNKKDDKEIWKQINEMRKEYRINEFGFNNDVLKMRRPFKKNIDAFTAQAIAKSLWKAYDKYLFGNGNKLHYKRYGELNSLEGKTNTMGIRFRDNHIIWNRLKIPVMIDENNVYEWQALQCDIRYCRIVRKFIRNKYKYYVQIVLKGNLPTKYDKETGEVKHTLGDGDVGLDIGPSTIAISSQKEVKMIELADRVQDIEDKKRVLMRKMDRSMRAMNPENYNDDGTIKKQGNKKVKWIKSNHYMKYQHQLKELYRKQVAVRKYQHECLANFILSLGNNIYVEKMNFSGLAKRASATTVNKKGKCNSKKRFGKSIANRAPAMLLEIINRKLSYYGEKLVEINTVKARASQYNHVDDTYTKKSLSQRWNDLNGVKVQRDMYSAFLIMNINDDLESFDRDKCNKRFEQFYELHNLEVDRLSQQHNLSSFGI